MILVENHPIYLKTKIKGKSWFYYALNWTQNSFNILCRWRKVYKMLLAFPL